MKKPVIIGIMLASALLSFSMAPKPAKPPVSDPRLDGLVRAPEFPSHLEWLNTDKPISLKNLQGKIVLLDFWTFCCINCMHVIPELKKLEEKYPEELVVIGVHSAKFENEKNTDSIRQAILRYEIKHPVLNDKDMETWQIYGVHAWPTLVLINPDGRIIGNQSGEDIFELFDGIISETIRYFDAKGRLKRSPMKLALEEAKREDTLLSFPGKIHAAGGRLFISDSNHNRILITDSEGNIQDSIGSGAIGQKDGDFETAELNHPQGTFLEGDFLYIADTENHLVRKADLKNRTVNTVLGTGEKATFVYGLKGVGTSVPLNSPWDLLARKGKLYLAMAGSHQLWIADMVTWDAKPFAGSGAEARVDGPLEKAALAQPSGISTDGTRLYFADSEVSSVRAADLDPSGKVETLIGEDLFEFGDIDGGRETARLQHALGVAYDRGLLYVADTYNSKIKIIDPEKKTSRSFAGTAQRGLKDGSLSEAQFYEPGGIAVMDGKIYVADTNNHQVRVIENEKVRTLQLSGLEKLAKRVLKNFRGRVVRLPEYKIREGKNMLDLSFALPEKYKFNAEAPIHLAARSSGQTLAEMSANPTEVEKNSSSILFQVPLTSVKGKHILTVDGVFYYCKKEGGVCLFEHIRYELPLDVSAAGPSEISLKVDVPIKEV